MVYSRPLGASKSTDVWTLPASCGRERRNRGGRQEAVDLARRIVPWASRIARPKT